MKTSQPEIYKAGARDNGRELVDFVARGCKLSRRRAKALLDSRLVLVNGKRIWMAKHPLERGDIVEVLGRLPDNSKDIHVLYRDADYVIIDKPAGMLSLGSNSAETRLRKQLKIPSLRAAHRIDKDTSGCLMMARSDEAFEAMVECFRRHEVVKTYRAIAAGRVNEREGLVQTALEDRQAVTRIRVLDSNREASHLAVRIETGRKHQIRKHLRRIQHPVLGDKQYTGGITISKRAVELPRHMLHAYSLEFPHPNQDKRVRVTAPLPRDFRDTLMRLRLR